MLLESLDQNSNYASILNYIDFLYYFLHAFISAATFVDGSLVIG